MATYIYGRETSPNEKVYTSEDYEKLRQELAQTKAELAVAREDFCRQMELRGEESSKHERLLAWILFDAATDGGTE